MRKTIADSMYRKAIDMMGMIFNIHRSKEKVYDWEGDHSCC